VRSIKIALCTPAHRQVEAKWAQCLAAMVAHTSKARIELDGEPADIEFEIFIVSSSLLLESRNRLVVEAINWGADYMLWMDADHVFPSDALLKLLSRSKLVVGCNYARRFTPTSPTASKYGEDDEMDLVWTTKEKAEAGELEEVAHLGLGFCLVDMRTYAILETQAEEAGKEHFWPLFDMPVKPDGIGCIGEDVRYFRMLREAGIKVFLDHEVSWDVGHLHEQILTNAHCIVQKPKYEDWTKRKLDKFKEKVA
jgi:hypothetical protein